MLAACPSEDRRSGRLLRVLTRLNIGGPARQELAVTPFLVERGFDDEIAWGKSSTEEGLLPVPPGTRSVHLPDLRRKIDPFADQRAYRALSRLIAVHRPNVVHTHMAKAGLLGRVAAMRRSVPAVVHTFHGHVLDGYFSQPATKAIAAAERGLARITDALVAVSPAVRDELLDLGIGTPATWHVIPLGLDLEPLLTSTIRRPQGRSTLGLPAKGPLVGIVGRLVPIKDHRTFVRAAAIVARDHPDATFVVAGDGPDRSSIESSARQLLGDRVVFLGWVDDLVPLYAALDVVVVTSRNEGTPVALIEAMAAGRPVVATRVGGVPDVIDDGRTGLLAPAADVPAVAAAISSILQTPNFARNLVRWGREASGRFGLDRLADDLAGLYGELLERAGGRGQSAG
jgi:glycosyltransferase involved in cell wall biosynthesis